MASRYLNSSCKHQQKSVRKYPVAQGPDKEINPKALCHLQTAASFACAKREAPQWDHPWDRLSVGSLWHWRWGGVRGNLFSSESFQAILRIIARI